MNNALLNYAIQYLERGASVIPVGRNKIPLIKWQEFQNRLPTQDEVIKWWTDFPDANIGIITGKISNVCVVDVEKGGDISKFPETDMVMTGGGGYHLYYEYTPFKNMTRVFPLTDVRGDGGYVVAVPSVHASGEKYKLVKHIGKKPFPIEMFGGISEKKWDFNILEGVGSGSRNESAAKVCGKILKLYPPEEWNNAYEFLKAWNDRNDPPLPEWELKNIFVSISKREASKKDIILKNIDNPRITFTDIVASASKEILTTKAEDIISLGYEWLDRQITGLFKSELLVLGGESGVGKTTLATEIIMKNSKNRKCMIFALEDRLTYYGKKALYFKIGQLRLKDYKAFYPWNDFVKNEIKDTEYLKYHNQAVEELRNENVEFYQSNELMTIEELGKLIKQKTLEGVELFLIDHLHYFDLLRGKDSKADNIERVMTSLRAVQNETGARIVMVVHYRKLNGTKPNLDSFKDSVSIVQNANYVINLWRDRSQKEQKKFNERIETEIYIHKARNPNGEASFKVMYDRQTSEYFMVEQVYGAPQNNDNNL